MVTMLAAAFVVVIMSADRSLNTPAAPAVMMVVSAVLATIAVVCGATSSRTLADVTTTRPALSPMIATALPAVALVGFAVAALIPICSAFAGGTAAIAPSMAAPAAPPAMPTFCTPALEATATVVPIKVELLTDPATTAPGVVPKFVGVPSAVPPQPFAFTSGAPAIADDTNVVPAKSDAFTEPATTAPGVVPKLVGTPKAVAAHWERLKAGVPVGEYEAIGAP